jgi:hypothetical protein
MVMKQILVREPMEIVSFRLPPHVIQRVKDIAKNKKKNGEKVAEADIYRSAILFFLDGYFTDSKVNNDDM